MKKTKKGIAVLLLVAILFNMSITSVFAAGTSEPKVYTKETKTLTLNENFSANGCDGAIYAHDDANLTINGTGEVHGELCGKEHDPENKPGEFCGYAMAVWAKNNTKITINGGTYTNDADTVSNDKTHVDLIYASNGSEITITGGTFKCSTPKWTLNCKDEKNTTEEVVLPSTITVMGGTFYQFDPSKAEVGEGEVIVPEGYGVVKNGDWYTVGKENTITVKETENGTISSTQVTAIVGEVVGLTIKANEGYKLANLTVTDANGKAVTVTNNEFTMPDSAVTVGAEFVKVTQNVVVPETVVQDTEEVEDVLLDSLEQDTTLEEEIANKDVVVNIELTDNNINVEEKEEIENVIKEKEEIKISKYFDISIIVKDEESGEEIGKLEKLTKEIKLTVSIPEDLPELIEGFTRKYYIVRVHNGVVEYLETTLSEDGKSLTFNTDKFSTYALAYEDVKTETNEKDETPKMGSINMSFVWMTLAVVAFVGIATTKKVSKHSK